MEKIVAFSPFLQTFYSSRQRRSAGKDWYSTWILTKWTEPNLAKFAAKDMLELLNQFDNGISWTISKEFISKFKLISANFVPKDSIRKLTSPII